MVSIFNLVVACVELHKQAMYIVNNVKIFCAVTTYDGLVMFLLNIKQNNQHLVKINELRQSIFIPQLVGICLLYTNSPSGMACSPTVCVYISKSLLAVYIQKYVGTYICIL